MSMNERELYFCNKINDKLKTFPYKVLKVEKIKSSYYTITTSCNYFDRKGEERTVIITCEKWLAKDLLTNIALDIIEC